MKRGAVGVTTSSGPHTAHGAFSMLVVKLLTKLDHKFNNAHRSFRMANMTLKYSPLVIVLGDTRDIYHHGCEAVITELCSALARVGLTPKHLVPGLNWRHLGSSCEDADLVVINGEGSLHHDRPIIDEVIALAKSRKMRGKATVLLNTSWYSNAPQRSCELIEFSRVFVRESTSAEQILHDGGPTVDIVPDLAIAHALRGGFRYSGHGRFMVSDSTKEDRTKRLMRLARKRGWEYLPILGYPTTARTGFKAQKIFRKARIAARLGRFAPFLLGPRYYSHAIGKAETNDYLARLTLSKGVVTGRFHTVCFSIALGVPFVAISSNTPKIESIIKDSGLNAAKRLLSIDHLSSLYKIPPYDDSELCALQTYCNKVIQAEDALFESIAKLVSVENGN